jgi:hypothetical protein
MEHDNTALQAAGSLILCLTAGGLPGIDLIARI